MLRLFRATTGGLWSCCQFSVSGFNLSPILVGQDVPESLSSHWDTICVMYVNNIKAVMQHLRSQRAEIDRRFYDMRYGFTAGLLHTLLKVVPNSTEAQQSTTIFCHDICNLMNHLE